MHAHWRALLDHRSTRTVRIAPTDAFLDLVVRLLSLLAALGALLALAGIVGRDPNATWLPGAGLPRPLLQLLVLALAAGAVPGRLLERRATAHVGPLAALALASVALADTISFYVHLAGGASARLPIPLALPAFLLLLTWVLSVHRRRRHAARPRHRGPWEKLFDRAVFR